MRSRLLIVDDEESLRTSLLVNLEDEGYEVTEAESGQEASELAAKQPFDLIVTDMRMPGRNGLETFREIRKLRSDALIMLMTGFANESLVSEALSEGAYTVLYKPFAMKHF